MRRRVSVALCSLVIVPLSVTARHFLLCSSLLFFSALLAFVRGSRSSIAARCINKHQGAATIKLLEVGHRYLKRVMHHNCPVLLCSASSSVPTLSSAAVPCSPLCLHPLRHPPPHPLSGWEFRDDSLNGCLNISQNECLNYGNIQGQNLFDDSTEDILDGSRLGNKFRGLSESQVLWSFSTDKEIANNVSKIKVVVCFVLHISLLCFL
ncbi:hypothetical protein Ahy_B08g090200 [Arachis hypogaea]|uniref:Uncharacterized protein n=1 Tax=Arachis hypogaea TaxID=3818 RepID=A0A444XZQ3_ARAHY|nr:hypothetical protein Ahy_B08g090200 [Arachis hypogaea]